MLKEYTLKVTVRVGGNTEDVCEEKVATTIDEITGYFGITSAEITHEEVVGVDEETTRDSSGKM